MPKVPDGTPTTDLSALANIQNRAANALTGLAALVRPKPQPAATLPQVDTQLATTERIDTGQVTGAGNVVDAAGDRVAEPVQMGVRDFNPLPPLKPRHLNGPETTGPRKFQYPMGANIIVSPRREYPDLTPFEQLESLAKSYDVSSMCIATRIEQLCGMGRAVVSKNKRAQKKVQSACDEVMAFFEKPDGLMPLDSWLASAVREHLVTDALTIFPKMSRGKTLYSLDLVSGATIKPVLDDLGRAVAYQQILYGFPFSDYSSASVPKESAEDLPIYSANELMYLPRFVSTTSPYGSPPTEWIILRVNQALRKQFYDIAWFSEGNIPDMIGTMPDGQMTPEQVEEFEEWFNSVLEGNDAARRKIRFIPWQANLTELKSFSYDTALDQWMLNVACAAYAVPPQELGFTNDVNRATAELQEAVNERRGLKPLSTWFKRAIFDVVIQQMYGRKLNTAISTRGRPTVPVGNVFAGLEWQWSFGDKTDMAAQQQTDSGYISDGVLKAEEVRAMRFPDIGDAEEEPSPPPEETDADAAPESAAGGPAIEGGVETTAAAPENPALTGTPAQTAAAILAGTLPISSNTTPLSNGGTPTLGAQVQASAVSEIRKSNSYALRHATERDLRADLTQSLRGAASDILAAAKPDGLFLGNDGLWLDYAYSVFAPLEKHLALLAVRSLADLAGQMGTDFYKVASASDQRQDLLIWAREHSDALAHQTAQAMRKRVEAMFDSTQLTGADLRLRLRQMLTDSDVIDGLAVTEATRACATPYLYTFGGGLGKAAGDGYGQLLIAPPLHPSCRCRLRIAVVNGDYIPVWWTDYTDACSKDQYVSGLGRYGGCAGLKNVCVAVGQFRGQRVMAGQMKDIPGQTRKPDVPRPSRTRFKPRKPRKTRRPRVESTEAFGLAAESAWEK